MISDSLACTGYRLNRRNFVSAAAGTFLGMNVRTLVARAGDDHKATAEHVILFWNGGGMSHIDTFDPKPGRPVQGDFSPIKTSASGVEISEIFPELAKQMKHIALVRSIAGTNGDHGRATYQLQTSYNPQSGSLQHPGLGSVVTRAGTPPGFRREVPSLSNEYPDPAEQPGASPAAVGRYCSFLGERAAHEE